MYQVEWVLEKRIVLMRAIGDQTVETIEAGIIRLHELFELGDAPVHLISDSRFMKRFPADVSAMKKLMYSNEKSGLSVVVGGDHVTKFVSKLMVAFSGSIQPMFVNTIEEAIALLVSKDNTLPKQIDYSDGDLKQTSS